MNSENKKPELQSEVLIMPDGKIYAHNLTPEMARVLSELNPDDESIQRRVVTHVDALTKKLLPGHWDETNLKL
jgi:hypothetical protein